MDGAAIASVIAQWGGFGAVLLAVSVYAYTLHKELKEQYEARVNDAKAVVSTLLALQEKFNSATANASELLELQSRTLEDVRTLVVAIDRRIDGIEQRRR